MRRRVLVLTLIAAAASVAARAGAQIPTTLPADFSFDPPPLTATDKFSARTINSHATVAPGGSMHVAVAIDVAETFWVYGPVPGGRYFKGAQGTSVEPGTTSLTLGEVLFGATHEHLTAMPDDKTDSHNVYEGRAYIYVPVTVPAGAPPGEVELPLLIEGQVCDPMTCLQLSTTVTATIVVGEKTVASPEWTGSVAAALGEARTLAQLQAAEVEIYGGSWLTGLGLAAGLAVAVLAGLIFNIMPCVLPVIPLRLMSLLNQAGRSRRRFVVLGLAFAGGIVLLFVGIAIVSVVLKLAIGYDVTLNDLFRHPPALIAVVLVLVALAMNLFGAFTVTVPGKVAEAGSGAGGGVLGTIGVGAVFAVLSVPCSGAIIAGLFVWTQTQPWWVGAVSLVLMGVGMASPHVAIAFFPQILSKIPRAGRWSELLKESVGFILLLIVVWLLGTQMSDAYLPWVMAYAVVLATCLWMWGTWITYTTPAGRKWAVRIAALTIAVAAGWWMLRPAAAPVVKMADYDAAAIGRARTEGRIVLVKFTARWCGECFVIERTVYSDREVADELERRGVAAFKGDLSKNDSPAWEMLRDQLRQAGPPITAVFPPGGGKPILLRGGFEKADLLKVLDQAQGS